MTVTTARYIGLRTWRYRPPTTSDSVGATGAGVPDPSVTKRAKAITSTAAPAATRATPSPRSGAATDPPERQSVSSQGMAPATTPGATTKNAAAPRVASGLRMWALPPLSGPRCASSVSRGLVGRDVAEEAGDRPQPAVVSDLADVGAGDDDRSVGRNELERVAGQVVVGVDAAGPAERVARVLGDHALRQLVERRVALHIEQRVDEPAVLGPCGADQVGPAGGVGLRQALEVGVDDRVDIAHGWLLRGALQCRPRE